jgi:hypothetical protein
MLLGTHVSVLDLFAVGLVIFAVALVICQAEVTSGLAPAGALRRDRRELAADGSANWRLTWRVEGRSYRPSSPIIAVGNSIAPRLNQLDKVS